MNKGIKVLASLLCLSLAFMIFSCKSAPKPEEATDLVDEAIEETVDGTGISELESLNKKIEEAREKAIENTADTLFAESFVFVEAEYEAHKAFSQTKIVGDEHIASAQRVLNRYEALNFSAMATKAKQRIDGFKFKSYDEAAYQRGEEKLSEAKKGYVVDFDTQKQRDTAQEAYLAFKSILNKAFGELATEKRQEVVAVRSDADSIKAGVADKAGYNSAMLKFTAGEEKFAEKEYEDASNHYQDAFTSLSELYEKVLQKRNKALREMEEAKKMNEAVDKLALEADEIAPLEDENGIEE